MSKQSCSRLDRVSKKMFTNNVGVIVFYKILHSTQLYVIFWKFATKKFDDSIQSSLLTRELSWLTSNNRRKFLFSMKDFIHLLEDLHFYNLKFLLHHTLQNKIQNSILNIAYTYGVDNIFEVFLGVIPRQIYKKNVRNVSASCLGLVLFRLPI